jgi:hypothetical protein
MALNRRLHGERLVAAADLRDTNWLETGGRIFDRLRNPAVRTATIDLSAVHWADPVPLLTLACITAEFAERGGELTIELGEPRELSNRFLIFLARQGFLAALGAYAAIGWRGKRYARGQTTALEVQLRGLRGLLAFGDAECIPAMLCRPAELDHGELDRLVESLVATAYPRVTGWLGGSARRRGLMLHRLRVILALP